MASNGKTAATIDVGEGAAAIVFHADEPPSLYMPEIDDDAIVPDHVMTALAVFSALEDEGLREAIRNKFEAMMDEAEKADS
ncbi:MAG: hypothetical protein ABFS30_10315 [Pseudomonadota bacterium]